MPKICKIFNSFFSALILALAYRIIADILNKKIEKRNKKKKEKLEKGKIIINEKEKEEINEEVASKETLNEVNKNVNENKKNHS